MVNIFPKQSSSEALQIYSMKNRHHMCWMAISFCYLLHSCHSPIHSFKKNVLSMDRVCYSNSTEQKQQEKGLYRWCLESSGTSFCVISLLGLHWHTLSYTGSETQGHMCGSPRSRSRHWSIQVSGENFLVSETTIFFLCPHMAEGKRALLGLLFRALIQIIRAPAHDLITSQRLYSLLPFHQWTGFQHMGLWQVTRAFSPWP